MTNFIDSTLLQNLLLYLTLSSWFIAVAWLLLRPSNYYRTLFNTQPKARFETLDGLRGFLALSVFVHHAVISQHFLRTGHWEITKQYPLYHFAADVGVSCFFMITGFLFWTKVLSSDGKINTTNFFKLRIKRLFPLYIFHVLVVIILAFSVRNFELWDRPTALIKNVLSWLAFGILGTPDINQVPNTSNFDAGVTWTLVYEWAFYVALPLLACFWRGRAFAIIVIIIFCYGYFVPSVGSISLFAYGMVAAYLIHNYRSQDYARNNWFALIGCTALLLATQVTGQFRHLLFFLFFLIVVNGNSFFGILTYTPSKLLGTISYSIYLLQGSVIFIVLHIVNNYYSISNMGPFDFFLATALCGTVLIYISMITFRFVENPFLVRTHPLKIDVPQALQVK